MRLRDEERGQALILVVVSMVVIFGMAAFAIDVAGWYQKHHQAQVSADAAALAAANCLATKSCSSTAANGDAYNTAASYAATNGVPAQSVTIGGGYVTVTTSTAAPLAFAGGFGLHPNVSASAVASYRPGQLTASLWAQDCSNPASISPSLLTAEITSPCAVNCSSQFGISITTSGNTSVTGAIQTNGSIYIKSNNNTTFQDVSYGDPAGTNCSTTTPGNDFTQNNAVITDGPPKEEAAFSYFPDTYYSVLSAGTDCVASAAALVTDLPPGDVVITPTSKTIELSGTNGSSTSPLNIAICAANSSNWASGYAIILDPNASLYGVTLTGSNITFASPGNGITITGDAHYTADAGDATPAPTLVIFDTTTGSLVLGDLHAANNISISGTAWAPIGNITLPGNNAGPGALVEANTLTVSGNNTGNGSPIAVPSLGTDALVQ
jgi:hypothetical protein